MTRRLVPILACSLVLGCGGAEPSTSDDSVGTGDTGTSDTGSTDTSDTSTTDTTDTTGDESCATPLPPEAMNPDNQLAFGIFFGGLELEIGSSLQFQVGLVQCCVFWDPLETCSEYTVEPEGAGATIDPQTGVLTLADEVVDGTVFTVQADVEQGKASVEADLFAYRPELHPLKGFWHEVARIPCGGGAEFVPSDPINELYFTAAGSLGVTWTPFEIYIAYTADYVADLDAGTLSLSGIGGNYVPADVDGEGLFSFEGDELVLEDMWLGSSQEAIDPPACGHRFAK